MESKECIKCKIIKTLDQFNKKRNGLQPFCRDCSKKAFKKHYQDNKQYYIDKTKRERNEVVNFVKQIKKNSSCKNCGENHPATLQFHHRDPKYKEFEIPDGINKGFCIKRIQKEIDKCDILCANCHFKEHYKP